MTIVAIQSGKFTTAGNLTGKNAAGKRVHISGSLVEALGYTPESIKTKPISFPLFAVAVTNEYDFNVLDSDGKATGEKKHDTRFEAGSIFATKEEAKAAINADKVLNLEATADLAKVATGLGLTEELLKDLASVAV